MSKYTAKEMTVVLILAGCAVALLSALWAYIFMLFWNWLMAGLFSLPVLNFWQSWGLSFFLGLIGNYFRSGSSK